MFLNNEFLGDPPASKIPEEDYAMDSPMPDADEC